MHKVCVKAVGILDEVVCLEVEECVSVGDLITRVFDLKGVRVSLEAVSVSDGSRTLKLSENVCSYNELLVFRLFRGG